jgi:hypothetical protein
MLGLMFFCPFEAGVQLSDNAIAVYFHYPAPGMRIGITSKVHKRETFVGSDFYFFIFFIQYV